MPLNPKTGQFIRQNPDACGVFFYPGEFGSESPSRILSGLSIVS